MKAEASTLTDRIANAPMLASGNATMAVMDRLQNYPVEVQVMAITSAFLLLCREIGVKPQTLYTYADNCMYDAEKRRPEFEGAASYIRNEVLTRSQGMIE